MRARAYVDGFNLYHGALEHRPASKWLDLRALSQALLPHAELDLVRYFTARVGSADGDPGAPQRQDVYWRALSGIDRLTIHRGKFQTETRKLSRAGTDRNELVSVRVPEEKGSDVNLATYRRAVGADERRNIHEELLLRSQLPDPASDEDFRTVRRPPAWEDSA